MTYIKTITTITSRGLFALLLAAPLTLGACQDDPNIADTGDTATDTGGDVIVETGSYYPLVDGAQWTYVATNNAGQVLSQEIVDATEITFAGSAAWLFSDNPNAAGEWTESTIAPLGTAAARVHKEIKDANGTVMIVDYDPGFVRVDDAWTSVGTKETLLYDRHETDGAGLNPKDEPRGHSFEVLAVDEIVTVPAGTFSCVQIERIRTVGATAGERVVFWYAAGIGKVREERPAEGRIEELASVSIPGGAHYP